MLCGFALGLADRFLQIGAGEFRPAGHIQVAGELEQVGLRE
jgi:hypothetical protein